MAEAGPLHMVVAHLGDELGAQRLPRQILPLAPTALRSRPALSGFGLVDERPFTPRMPFERVDSIRRQKLDQLAALDVGEAGRDADMLQGAGVVMETEEQRADRDALVPLVPAESGDDAIAFARVLHLQHDALVGLVDAGLRLRHHTVEAGTLESPEPVGGDDAVARRWRQMDRRLCVPENGFERSATLRERRPGEVAIAFREEIEEDERGGDLGRQELYP